MENEQKRPLRDGTLWACVTSLVCAVTCILVLFAPVIVYETKFVVDGQKIKESFPLSMVQLFDDAKYFAWQIGLVVSIFGLAAILSGSLFYLTKFKKGSKLTNGVAVAMAFTFLAGFFMLFINKEIFINFAQNSAKAIENFNGASLSYGSAISMLFAMIGTFAAIGCSDYANSRSARSIAEDGILIAAAFVLNFIKLPIAANGGSINFQMLPLFIIALRRGPLDGFVAGGVVYGLLTCLTDGYGFATYPFDYLIGFGSVAALGFFRSLILGKGQTSYNIKGILFLLLGGTIATFLRFVGGCASSMAIYGYELVPAMSYNAVYIFVSGAISLAVLIALYGPLAKINALFPVARQKEETISQ